MLVTGWSTVTTHEALRLLPSLVVAVIVAVPRFNVVTFPKKSTLATVGEFDDQATDLSSAVSGKTAGDMINDSPTLSVLACGVREISVANCSTVTMHESLKLLPSVVVAVIVATPFPVDVTVPSLATVATLLLLDDHTTAWLLALLGVVVATSLNEKLS